MTNAQRKRYDALQEKLAVAYAAWQANTDKSKHDKLYSKVVAINAKIDKLVNSIL
ncbi:hypothetical protein [Escherichia phage ULINTec4]|uniref:Uncharacterized protein n=9 Tax=Vectrevirus TaxID=2732928 RepID=A0A1Q1PU43_9CAUD|nr:hypothetical protein HOR57_gp30 [Escherichia phage vB_EcoP_B]YP_009795377.1 hypothetical protein HOS42_gp04 [Escherichia phage mutPK1A2]YP_424971.1 hypothetical protein PK1Ep05 [Escherichia phage K1E]UCR91756.1 hypothetical protein [Escherichia phage ULINTec4]UCR91812.1 hypothetical protein [Escherichia phage ULINTec6]UCR91868.1 hypothetical protein [Escherichia phage ULINTec7]AQN31614.1 hypothetical protein B_30 [Escherichia phage vB_EcoP_B]ATS93306.1 hypothetical protein mutPK1A2_p04 [E